MASTSYNEKCSEIPVIFSNEEESIEDQVSRCET